MTLRDSSIFITTEATSVLGKLGTGPTFRSSGGLTELARLPEIAMKSKNKLRSLKNYLGYKKGYLVWLGPIASNKSKFGHM
jgi:hypothetical protein